MTTPQGSQPRADGPPPLGDQGSPEPAGGDWTQQVTDLVTDTVDKVRSRTTGPLMGVAHGVVYALVAAIVAIPVVVVLFVGLIRLLNWAIPGDVWIVYAIIAVVTWLVGAILWSKRNAADAADGV